MDVMLVYPPISVEERYGSRKVGKKVGGHLPPLGIACLAAFVREKGYAVDVVDSLALEISNDDLLKRAADLKPKVIGFSILTMNYHRAVESAKILREQFPDILFIVGGHHASIMPKEIMQDNSNCFDLLVYGEGELTLLELLDKYKESDFNKTKFLKEFNLLKNIKGIVFKKHDEVVLNERRELIQDLDILPFPARDLLPMDKYIPLPNQYLRLPVVHMTVIRGCAFQCAFCSNNSVFGRRIRAKSPKRAVDEIEHVMKMYGARELSFWDDTMTTVNKWMEDFCDEILNRHLNVTWTCYSRVDTVTLELLKKMKQAGCWNIFYGFEAGNQQLLDNICKGITLDQIRNANNWTKEAGIEVRASFMIALPGETPELAQETINFAIELDPDYAQFSITTPYPGTRLWQDVEKFGTLNKDFSKYHLWEPVFVPFGYKNKEQIMEVEKKAFKQFYLRPKFIIKSLRKIRSIEDIKRYIKGLRFLLGFV